MVGVVVGVVVVVVVAVVVVVVVVVVGTHQGGGINTRQVRKRKAAGDRVLDRRSEDQIHAC